MRKSLQLTYIKRGLRKKELVPVHPNLDWPLSLLLLFFPSMSLNITFLIQVHLLTLAEQYLFSQGT